MREIIDYTEDEILIALKNMQNKTPNDLKKIDENTNHLFETIIKIADERDNYKEKIVRAHNLAIVWGEVLNPVFQKRLLDILEGKEDE